MSCADLERFLHEFPIPGRATFFCHETYPCLTGRGHELCPHPFISSLEDWRAPVQALTDRINPGAKGIRAHSCVFSHAICVGLREMGFTFVSQANNLYQPGLYPFRHPWGVWELPLYYMDNMDFWAPVNWPGDGHQPFASRWIEHAVSGSALYVFDFHPVHVALNTRSPEDYQRVKHQIIERGVSPFDLAFEGRGAREYFMELCAAMRTAGQRSMTCSEALDAWSRHER